MFHGDFVEELHSPLNIPLADKVDAPGRLVVNASFPDPEGVLETAYDFARRLKCGDLLLETKLCETSVFEEYIIRTEPGKCIIDFSFFKQPNRHFCKNIRRFHKKKVEKNRIYAKVHRL